MNTEYQRLKPSPKTPATQSRFGSRMRFQLRRTLRARPREKSNRSTIFVRLSSMKTTWAASVAMLEAPRSEIDTSACLRRWRR